MFFLSNNLFAATLSIADNLVLRELNDERLNDSFFSDLFSGEKSIHLSKGRHTLLVKYKDVYEDLDFAEERVVESALFIVKFNLAEQQKLKLMTPKIKDLSAAEKFSQSPEIILLDENNDTLVLQLEKHDDYKLAKQVERVVTALPESDEIIKETEEVIIPSQEVTITQTGKALQAESETFSEQVLTQTKSLPMLKYWWQKASTEEKNAFTLYMKGQAQ